ncbi:hypothetical protein [Acutalibacter muris]|uniref:hypothetical protein n=1 Tax=Acutalibacter muris TaxID=1796620 RepID=UPI001C3E9F86|nr:hypothetical protein [Acutalibacter muris]
MRKKRKIHAIESGSTDRSPPPQNTRKSRNPKEFRDLSVAGAEGFEPSARGFGVDVEKASAEINQPVFRAVEPFVFPRHTSEKFLMIY